MIEKLLSVEDVAAFLGVKRDSVYKLIDRNRLPAREVGRLWKFLWREIDAWLDKHSGCQKPKISRSSHRRGV